MQDPLTVGFMLVVTLGVGSFGGVVCIRRFSHARYLKDTPASKIRSAAQGYVELTGLIEAGAQGELYAPLTRKPCLWWRYRIEEEIKTDRGSRWQVKQSQASGSVFKLNDLTGTCLINPRGAEVFTTVRERWYGNSPVMGVPFGGGRYRYTEERLCAGEFVYAAGDFVTRNAALTYVPEEQAKHFIREWKQDFSGMLQRFDGNRNGKLEEYEWERVQQAALAHARATHKLLQQEPDEHYLQQAVEAQPFVISTHGKDELVKKLITQGFVAGVVCLVGVLSGIWIVKTQILLLN